MILPGDDAGALERPQIADALHDHEQRALARPDRRRPMQGSRVPTLPQIEHSTILSWASVIAAAGGSIQLVAALDEMKGCAACRARPEPGRRASNWIEQFDFEARRRAALLKRFLHKNSFSRTISCPAGSAGRR